ncbi:MAG: gliding motility-associated C-terminal domain-containing protein [Bacteroidia bacterium]
MQKITFFFLFILLAVTAHAQDDCSFATPLCGSFQATGSTVGATMSITDPALDCGDNTVNNSVWFTIEGINTGTATVVVSGIDNNPGLEMEIYTGNCGSLAPIAGACTSANGPAGSMTLNFAVSNGNTYFIMVDGNAGNQEAFTIVATATNNAIIGAPQTQFTTNVLRGCTPLNFTVLNQTVLYGGSNISYSWTIDTGTPIIGSGADTSFTISSVGQHNVLLNVCNDECGCVGSTRSVTVQELIPAIDATPTLSCLGTPIDFSGSATIQPAFPPTNPNVTLWQWDFGDPNSGASNTTTGQNVQHTFVGPGNSFTVTLTTNGTCGPESTTTVVTMRPKPVINAGGPQTVCEDQDINLSAVVSNGTSPITYSWGGPGAFSCPTCSTTVLSTVPPGGPYSVTIDIVDSLGCTADTTVDVTINPKPIINAGTDVQVCRYDVVAIDAFPIAGTQPLSYTWTPSTGLSDDTLASTFATVTAPITYCVTAVDPIGCTSDPACINITLFPPPTISASVPTLCATQPVLQNTFTVTGADPSSAITWVLSPNYSLITSVSPDSFSIDVTFPPGIAATYTFTAIVDDANTGCKDTVSTSFTVTPGLNMSISGATQVCQGDAVPLTASGAITYVWTASPAYAFADPTLASQSVTPTVTTTFTVTGTNGSCTQVITHMVTVNAKPVAVAAPITPFCGCDTIDLNGTGSTPGMTYSWTSAIGYIVTSPSSLNTTAYVCSNDLLTLRVTDPATGCFKDSAVSATARPKPNAAANVTPNLICNGVSTVIALDATGSNTVFNTTYNWSSNSVGVPITDTAAFSTTATVNGTTVFYLTVTDSLGCDSTASDTVNVYPIPTFTASNPFICTSDPVLLSTLSINGATAGSNYNWTTIPGCVSPSTSTNPSETFDFSTCGPSTYNFAVTVTDIGTNCITSLNQDITVLSGVVLSVSSDPTICEGDSALLFASGANTYSWTGGATTDSIYVSGLSAAGSPYTVTVTGAVGSCTNSRSILITVNPIPATAPISGSASVCENDSSLLYVVTPTGGNYTWTITGGTIDSGQNSDSVMVSWDSAGVGTLSVVDTNAFGCPGPVQTLVVTINPLPDSSNVIQGPTPVCENSVETYFVNANAGSTYYFFASGGTVLSQANNLVTIQWLNAGIGNVTMYEVNATNCTGPVLNYDVIINPRPQPAAISGTASVCDSSTEIYTVPMNVGSTYNWMVTGGTITNISANQDSLEVFWAGSGSSLVEVSETNSFGCTSDTTNISVAVNIRPQAIAQPDSAGICQGGAFQISGNVNIGTIHWYSSGTGVFSDSTIASPQYIPSSQDTGYITLTMVVSGPPCENDTADVVLYVSPAPVVSITGTLNTLCFGQSDTITAIGGGTYVWMPGGLIDSTIIVQPLISTQYVVTVTNNFNCSTNDTLDVTVIPPGIPNAGPDLLICLGDSVMLNGTQQNAGGLIWTTLGNGTFSPSNGIPTPYYVPGIQDTSAGFAQIVLTTTGACLNLTDTLLLNIEGLPSLYAGKDTVVTSGPNTGVNLPLTPLVVNSPTIIWTSTGTGTFSPSDTSANATYTPSEADFALDSVILTITATGGCITLTDQLKIEFTPFVIPNVFTPYPNSPGYNDYFEIKNLPVNSKLKIWDRWGLIVYVTDNYRNDWDAALLKSDTYYYLLILEDNKEYHGWIQVIRD